MKKQLLFVLVLLGFGFSANAQCSVDLGDDIVLCNGNPVTLSAITTGVTAVDSIRIVYDATQGVSGLAGASEVYFHSGIQTVPFGGFEYTVGNWGQDDGVGEMIPLGNDLWEITIHPESYYGYPNGTNVIGLWMVFRNGDGSEEGKDDNDNDIFVETSNNNNSTFGGVTVTDIPAQEWSYVWNTQETTQSISVSQSGTYSVTFTDGVGCTATDGIEVEFSTGSVSVDLGPDTAICNGEILTLDAGAGFASYEWSTSETSQTLEVNQPGDYIVTVTDANGCTGIDIINVTTGVSPFASFSYSPVTGTTVEFTDDGVAATTVYWDFNGDGNIDETTAGGATVQYDFGAETVFGVTMIAENGCGSDTTSQNVLVQDVSVEELKAEIGFSVYPIPTFESISVSITDNAVVVETITLSDLQGRLIEEIPVMNQSRQVIALDQLPAGIYVLQVSTTKGLINQRIIKQ